MIYIFHHCYWFNVPLNVLFLILFYMSDMIYDARTCDVMGRISACQLIWCVIVVYLYWGLLVTWVKKAALHRALVAVQYHSIISFFAQWARASWRVCVSGRWRVARDWAKYGGECVLRAADTLQGLVRSSSSALYERWCSVQRPERSTLSPPSRLPTHWRPNSRQPPRLRWPLEGAELQELPVARRARRTRAW